MNITIEQNKIIVNLDETEFPKFQKMFANLQLMKSVRVEFRDFPEGNGNFNRQILPMHLCRTIGEANLSEDPFATVSLYPFWKHGFAFGSGASLALNPQVDDPHKIANFSDEVGMGLCVWSAEEIFKCVEWADTSALIKAGAVFPTGLKLPDIICTFPDSTLGVFEAKGTTGGSIAGALAEGKIQTVGITAPVQIKLLVVVGTLIGEPAKIILLDPPSAPLRGRGSLSEAETTNLTPEIVAKAATLRQTQGPKKGKGKDKPVGELAEPTETIFRSAEGEIKLVNEQKPEKKHGWLDVK